MKRAIIRWSKVPDGSFKVLQRRQSKELHKHSDIETAFNDIEFHIYVRLNVGRLFTLLRY